MQCCNVILSPLVLATTMASDKSFQERLTLRIPRVAIFYNKLYVQREFHCEDSAFVPDSEVHVGERHLIDINY